MPRKLEQECNVSGETTDQEVPFLPRSVGHKPETISSTTIAKLNSRITFICWLISTLNYIDRGNLGFAASKVCDALHLTHTEYGLGASLFFVGYLFSQAPSNVMLKKVGPARWFAFLLIFWGVIASSLAFVQTDWQFYCLRFLLGVAEGGCFPGLWYILSCFFPNAWITYPLGIVHSSVSLSQIVSAPIAAALLALDGIFGIEGWRLLFFVEGIIPIIFGAFLPWILPSTVQQTTFLTEEEKNLLMSQLTAEAQGPSISFWSQLKSITSKGATWWLTMSSVCRFGVVNVFIYFTSLIIDEMLNGGDDDDADDDTCASSSSNRVTAVLLTAIPFTMMALFTYLIGHYSSNVKDRPRVGCVINASASLFLILWALTRHVSFVVALLSMGFASGLNFAPVSYCVSILLSVNESNTKAVSLAFINSVATVGAIVCPLLLGILIDQYNYTVGVTALSIFPIVSGLLLLPVYDPQRDA